MISKQRKIRRKKISFCCKSDVYFAPEYYSTKKNNFIKTITVCSNCGKKTKVI